MTNEIDQYQNFYFIGILGISMRSIAEILSKMGKNIVGTDINDPCISNCKFFPYQDYIQIPEEIDCVVWNTGKENHPDLIYAKENDIPTMHRAKALDLATLFKYKYLITGTDGKTTNCFFLYLLFEKLGYDPFPVSGACLSKGKYFKAGEGPFIVEHNEGDLNHHVDSCDTLIFTNFDEIDHIFCFNNCLKTFKQKYTELVNNVKDAIIYNIDDRPTAEIIANSHTKAKLITFGQSENAEWKISNLIETIEDLSFDLIYQNQNYPIKVKVHGDVCSYSIVASIAAIYQKHKNLPEILSNLQILRNPNSRFTLIHEDNRIKIISSLISSATAIRDTIRSLKKYNQPINVLMHLFDVRFESYAEEMIELLKDYRWATLNNKLATKVPKDVPIICSQEDFNKFVDDAPGIYLVVHGRYHWHGFLENYIGKKLESESPYEKVKNTSDPESPYN